MAPREGLQWSLAVALLLSGCTELSLQEAADRLLADSAALDGAIVLAWPDLLAVRRPAASDGSRQPLPPKARRNSSFNK